MKKLIKILDLLFQFVAWFGMVASVFAEEYSAAILLAILLIHNKLTGGAIIIIKESEE